MRYSLPIWAVLQLTNWLPENGVVCALRGGLLRCLLKNCGHHLSIGKDATINTPDRLSLGDNCYLAKGTWVQAFGSVTLEDDVVCGPYVVLASTNHQFRNGTTVKAGTLPEPIFIGRGTWIGAHAVITAGVTIGKGNLIAAGAVVTRDTPDNVIVGGVPGRVLGPRQDTTDAQLTVPTAIHAA